MTLEAMAADHPFLRGFRSEHLKLLGANALPAQFAPDEVIFREGEMANRFYLITRGHVILESCCKDRAGVKIQEIGAGDVLGWSWLFPPYYWRLDARAAEQTEAVFFYGTRLRQEAEQDHDFGYELMRRVANVAIHRLQAARAIARETTLTT